MLDPRTTAPPARTAAQRPTVPLHSLALAGLLAAAALVVGVASVAHAHNVLRSSDPGDGSTVPAPTEVTLTFDESVQTLGTAVQVTGPKGLLQLEPLVVDGRRIVQPLPERLAAGAYTVLWRATSSDGHPIDGTIEFTATPGTQAPAPATSPPAATTAPATTVPPSSAVPPPSTSTTPTTPTTPSATPGSGTITDAAPASSEGDGGTPWLPWLALAAAAGLLGTATWWWSSRRDGTAP